MRSQDAPVRSYLLGFVLIGVVLSLAGPSLSYLRDRMGTDNGGIAVVFVGASLGYIVGSMLAGRGLDHGQGHRRWVMCMALCTVSILAVAAAPNLPLLVASFVVLGATCGLGDVSGNTLVLWSRPDGPGPMLNALHLCFAVGAVFAPALVWLSIHFTDSLWPLALPVGALTVAFGSRLLRQSPPVRTRLDTVERSHQGGARGLHVAMLCAFYFSYVALETGFAGWIHSYTEQIGYGTAATATGMITTFWVGFMLGRLASIWVSRRVPAGALVGWSMALSVAAAVLFLVFRSAGPMLWVVTFVFALSVAPQYASMMAFAEQHLALSGRNASAIVASSGIGGLFMPWLLGQLFDARGPQSLPVVMVVLAVVTSLVAAVVGRLLAAAQRPPATSSSAPVT
jgi:FHS family Na+ dependent glucose MFS transporter 1